jgi:hypothetical protein
MLDFQPARRDQPNQFCVAVRALANVCEAGNHAAHKITIGDRLGVKTDAPLSFLLDYRHGSRLVHRHRSFGCRNPQNSRWGWRRHGYHPDCRSDRTRRRCPVSRGRSFLTRCSRDPQQRGRQDPSGSGNRARGQGEKLRDSCPDRWLVRIGLRIDLAGWHPPVCR